MRGLFSKSCEIAHTHALWCDLILFFVAKIFVLHVCQMRAVSTPALRECIDVKLLCGDVMMEMFEQHMDEMRKKQMADMRKGSVVKVREASALCVAHSRPSNFLLEW